MYGRRGARKQVLPTWTSVWYRGAQRPHGYSMSEAGRLGASKIALVTYSQDPTLSRGDRLLGDALARRGCDVSAVPWDDLNADWASFDICVIRSTWDYHHRLTEF